MNRFYESDFQAEVDRLLNALENQEVPIYELGTPDLLETEDTNALINMGQKIVPYLVMRSEESPSKTTAYIVYILGRLGDRNVVPHLLKLRERFQKLDAKTEWDYAVIGQCNLAIERLNRINP